MKKTHWILAAVAGLVLVMGLLCAGLTVIGGVVYVAGPTVVEALTTTHDDGVDVVEDEDGDGVDDKTPGDPRCRKDVPHCMKVREARAKIAPFDKDILEYATKAYNRGVPDHIAWAKRCIAQREVFERIERKTLYPLPLIMGIASHESMGCYKVTADNGDGGTSFMQVTNASPVFKARAAAMLGINPKDINVYDPVHNVAIGMVMWDDCERRTGRRDVAPLCYNRGIGAVNAIAPWAQRGWSGTKPYPRFVLMYPYINTKVYRTTGPVARSYTGKVLAHMAIIAQLLRGETPKDIPAGHLLPLTDLPADPKHDGDEFVVRSAAEE